MRTINSEFFYAKILLFGEYSVLLNSMGLSIPYTRFYGKLSFIGEDKYVDLSFAQRSNSELLQLFSYLYSKAELFRSLINLDLFENDISNGLYFKSNIPEGYGLGSSGALCAAVYKYYGVSPIANSKKICNSDMIRLKNVLSLLESEFHGSSSGLDPLNSYLKVPLLIHNKKEIEQVCLPENKFGKDDAIFLINTGKPGNTEPLVGSFLANCKKEEYVRLMQKELIPANNECVRELMNGNADSFFKKLKTLSLFQLENFNGMIPDGINEIWKNGLRSQNYFLKLCGSGGGGYLLGFTREYSQARLFFFKNGFDVDTVYVNEK